MSNKKEVILYTAASLTISYFIIKGVTYIFKLFKNKNKNIIEDHNSSITLIKSDNKNVKLGILDLMKNTPMIYIKSLSELTGCKIYAKCEYYLPYTSKDRMIKNILLDAKE